MASQANGDHPAKRPRLDTEGESGLRKGDVIRHFQRFTNGALQTNQTSSSRPHSSGKASEPVNVDDDSELEVVDQPPDNKRSCPTRRLASESDLQSSTRRSKRLRLEDKGFEESNRRVKEASTRLGNFRETPPAVANCFSGNVLPSPDRDDEADELSVSTTSRFPKSRNSFLDAIQKANKESKKGGGRTKIANKDDTRRLPLTFVQYAFLPMSNSYELAVLDGAIHIFDRSAVLGPDAMAPRVPLEKVFHCDYSTDEDCLKIRLRASPCGDFAADPLCLEFANAEDKMLFQSIILKRGGSRAEKARLVFPRFSSNPIGPVPDSIASSPDSIASMTVPITSSPSSVVSLPEPTASIPDSIADGPSTWLEKSFQKAVKDAQQHPQPQALPKASPRDSPVTITDPASSRFFRSRPTESARREPVALDNGIRRNTQPYTGRRNLVSTMEPAKNDLRPRATPINTPLSTVRATRSSTKDSPDALYEGLTTQKAATEGRTTRARLSTSKPAPRLEDAPEPPRYSEIVGLGKAWESPLIYPATGKRRTEVEFGDLLRLDEGEFLNDNLIAFYLRYLEHHLEQTNPELARKVYFYNSFFLDRLVQPKGKKGINYEKVQKSTRNVDIFEHEYLIVPVNQNLHWYVAIICNLPNIGSEPDATSSPIPNVVSDLVLIEDEATGGTQQESQDVSELPSKGTSPQQPKRGKRKSRHSLPKVKTSTPVIMTLDSVGASHSGTCQALRQYLVEEGSSKKGMEINGAEIKGMTAKGIPEQSNYSDCGLYLCAYMEKFILDPAAFVGKILQREMNGEVDMPMMNTGELRGRMRELIMQLHQNQEGQRKPLPEVGSILLLPPKEIVVKLEVEEVDDSADELQRDEVTARSRSPVKKSSEEAPEVPDAVERPPTRNGELSTVSKYFAVPGTPAAAARHVDNIDDDEPIFLSVAKTTPITKKVRPPSPPTPSKSAPSKSTPSKPTPKRTPRRGLGSQPRNTPQKTPQKSPQKSPQVTPAQRPASPPRRQFVEPLDLRSPEPPSHREQQVTGRSSTSTSEPLFIGQNSGSHPDQNGLGHDPVNGTQELRQQTEPIHPVTTSGGQDTSVAVDVPPRRKPRRSSARLSVIAPAPEARGSRQRSATTYRSSRVPRHADEPLFADEISETVTTQADMSHEEEQMTVTSRARAQLTEQAVESHALFEQQLRQAAQSSPLSEALSYPDDLDQGHESDSAQSILEGI